MSQAGNYIISGGGAGGANEIKITKFTSNGTFNKDANSVWITVLLWNASGGGGSGRQGVSTMAGGGGGGAGGGLLYLTFPSFQFAASETVTIGAGGTGGAPQTMNDTDGIDGTDGGKSSVGNITVAIATSAIAQSGGRGGTSTLTTSGGIFQALCDDYADTVGSINTSGGYGAALIDGNRGGYSAEGLVSNGTNNVFQYPGSGGGGGAGANNATPSQAGDGGPVVQFFYEVLSGVTPTIIQAGGAGGIETGTIDGGNGTDFISTSGGRFVGATGGGGGGGQYVGAVAGNGGNGGIPSAGGGGGGGSLNGTDSGSGGDGSRGEIWIIETLGTLTT